MARTYNRPYGDIYTVETPHLNKFADRMYAQEQQREANQRLEVDRIDKMMMDEVGTIRAADREEYLNLYGDYKAKKKQLLFDNKLQRDSKRYAQAQLQADQAFIKAKTFAGESAELNDGLNGLSKGFIANPRAYNRDASQRIDYARRAPLKDLRGTKYTDIGSYMYGGPGKEFIETLQKSGGVGNKKKRYSKEEPYGTSGWQNKRTEFLSGNTDREIKDFVMNSFVDDRNAEDAERLWEKEAENPERMLETIKVYNNISPELMEIKTGDAKHQKLTIDPNMSKAEKYATLHAMRTFLADEPELGKEEIKVDEGKKREQDLKDKKDYALFTSGLAANNIELAARLRKEGKEGDDKKESDILDGIYNDIVAESEASGKFPHQYTYPGGKVVRVQPIDPANKAVRNIFAEKFDRTNDGVHNPEVVPADHVSFGEDGYVRYSFWKYGKSADGKTYEVQRNEKGSPLTDASRSGKMTKKEFKIRLGKTIFTTAEAKKMVDND